MRQNPPPSAVTPPINRIVSQQAGELLVAGTYFAVLLYVVGWSYAANFYSHFHVGLQSLQIPVEYFFVYAMVAVKLLWWMVLMFSVFIAADLFVLWWLGLPQWYRMLTHFWRMTLWVAVGISLLVVGVKLGEIAGRQAFENGVVSGFPEIPAVRVFLKESDKAPPWRQRLAPALEQGCYRLLAQNNNPGRLFLFRDTPLVTGIPVETIAEGEVAFMRLLPRPVACEGPR